MYALWTSTHKLNKRIFPAANPGQKPNDQIIVSKNPGENPQNPPLYFLLSKEGNRKSRNAKNQRQKPPLYI